MSKKDLSVQGINITFIQEGGEEFISLTDMTKRFEDPKYLIENWMRNRNTVEFLGTWELLHNPHFNSVGFDDIRMNAGLNTFKLSVKAWIESTNAVGFRAKAGRYGGTYAHPDIALNFGIWLSPAFQVYLNKEYRRLKEEEATRLQESWDLKRELSKINYRIHTDAIRDSLVPPEILGSGLEGVLYASEADLLNKALFGKTAKEWKEENPSLAGNMRDHASAMQLILMSNLESLNAEFIRLGLSQQERLYRLNQAAIAQAQSLVSKQKTLEKLFEQKSALPPNEI